MKLTHYGHACVTIEDMPGSGGRIVVDPGNLADDTSTITEVSSVLVTHEHPDHLDPARLDYLRATSPAMQLYVNPGTEDALSAAEAERVEVLDSDRQAGVDVGGVDVRVITTAHATIYEALPPIGNNAYLIGGRVFHPGDAFVVPDFAVEVLLLPIGAPWLKLSEAIDYLQTVAPSLAIPIHQGGLGEAHRSLHTQLLQKFAPKGSELSVLESGKGITL